MKDRFQSIAKQIVAAVPPAKEQAAILLSDPTFSKQLKATSDVRALVADKLGYPKDSGYVRLVALALGWQEPKVDYSPDPNDEYLYHVAPLSRKKNIIRYGLRGDRPSNWPEYGYSGKVFLTEKRNIEYWIGRVSTIDEFNGGNGKLVIFRVPKSIIENRLQVDKLGSEDSKGDAYFVEGDIEPRYLQVVKSD